MKKRRNSKLPLELEFNVLAGEGEENIAFTRFLLFIRSIRLMRLMN
jgi:hypothetical protein